MSRAEVTALRERCLRGCSRERWGEAAALAVLLGCSHFATDPRLYRHVSADGVDWERVLADRTWSTSERFILGTAAGLWSGRPTLIDISRMAFLDERMHALWQDMLTAARTGRLPEGAVSPVIEIRLRGTRSDCDQAAATLLEVFRVLSVSRPCPDRGAATVRVFCRAELKDHEPHEEEA